MKSVFSAFMVTLILVTTLIVAFDVRPVKASGTIYIRADGSIDPPTANITTMDNVTYTFTDNNYDSLVIEKNDIVIDGAGYTLQGNTTLDSRGIDLTGRTNVAVQNTHIENFTYGIMLTYSSSNNSISGNTVTANSKYGILLSEYSTYNSIIGNAITANNEAGIWLWYSPYGSIIGNINSESAMAKIEVDISLFQSGSNTISGNTITGNGDGIWLFSSSANISGNTITANNGTGIYFMVGSSRNSIIENNITANSGHGILLAPSSYNNSISGNTITANDMAGISLYQSGSNTISKNILTNNGYGIYLYSSSNSNISGNSITTSNAYGIWLDSSSNNKLCHNNVIDNTQQVLSVSSTNTWDDGYPRGGNYWSDYTDVDSFKGEHQNETGSDGVWDHPYVIDGANQDGYPLTKPYGGPAGDVDGDHDVDIFDIVRMAGVYGVKYPAPRYDRLCDMNLDGDIDIFDLVMAAGNYGKSW